MGALLLPTHQARGGARFLGGGLRCWVLLATALSQQVLKLWIMRSDVGVPARRKLWRVRPLEQMILALARWLCLCRERNIPEIQSMYEISFLKLSDRYYKASPWPEVQHIAEVVDHDHVFCLLYKVRGSGDLAGESSGAAHVGSAGHKPGGTRGLRGIAQGAAMRLGLSGALRATAAGRLGFGALFNVRTCSLTTTSLTRHAGDVLPPPVRALPAHPARPVRPRPRSEVGQPGSGTEAAGRKRCPREAAHTAGGAWVCQLAR